MFLKLETSSYEVVFYTISLLVYIMLTIFNTLYTLTFSMNFYLFENRNMNLMLNIDIISLLLLTKIKEYAKKVGKYMPNRSWV